MFYSYTKYHCMFRSNRDNILVVHNIFIGHNAAYDLLIFKLYSKIYKMVVECEVLHGITPL